MRAVKSPWVRRRVTCSSLSHRLEDKEIPAETGRSHSYQRHRSQPDEVAPQVLINLVNRPFPGETDGHPQLLPRGRQPGEGEEALLAGQSHSRRHPFVAGGHGLDERLRQHFADVFQGFGITEKNLPGGIGQTHSGAGRKIAFGQQASQPMQIQAGGKHPLELARSFKIG